MNERIGPLGRYWVKFEELVRITGFSGQKLWGDFWALSSEVTWGYLWYSHDLQELIQGREPPDFSQDLFVPAKWAEEVLRLLISGVSRVETRSCSRPPRNTIRSLPKPAGGVLHVVAIYEPSR